MAGEPTANPYVNRLRKARHEIQFAEEVLAQARQERAEALLEASHLGLIGMSKIAAELGISRTLANRIRDEAATAN